ncbi:hypothetical protein DdX_15524 [Ditylenchus destructor]|uniref:Uncharacterized protein n=1 Tax=Ditylenchus destructor TaxID=166010 RepID=A0AAD4MS18_9BILA|nr:hypothetical protein DdX_15524 [Ditylenchus destructor]
MNYYFVFLILAGVSSVSAYYGPGHNRTREKQRLNAKIKENFPEILAFTSPGSHYDLNKTLDDILKGFRPQLDVFPFYKLLVLDRLNGFVVRSKGDQGLESNLLTPLLPPPKYEQAGEIGDQDNIYDLMGDLANRYVDLLEEEGEIKEIHVVPIAEVEDGLDHGHQLRPVILFGVLGKQRGSANNLVGMAGLIARIK